MKKFLSILCFLLFLAVIVQTIYIFDSRLFSFFSRHITKVSRPLPLLAYTFVNLKKTRFPAIPITLGMVTANHQDFVSQLFFYDVPIRPKSDIFEKVSGLINIPKKPGNYPVIVMFRGFVPN